MKIGLVACVSKKQSISTQAQWLYVSPWFYKASDYAKRFCDRWFILSAKYGLLAPEQVIQPYNQTLTHGMSRSIRQQWALGVTRELRDQSTLQDEIVILAGQKYREFLVPYLRYYGYHVTIPMAGLSIGRQLSWLNHQNV